MFISTFLLFLACLHRLQSQLTPSATLQTNHCNMQSPANKELQMQISRSTIDRSSFQIMKTQQFQSNGKTVNLAYIQTKDSLMVEQTRADLVSKFHQQTITNQLRLIDAKDQYLIAAEITNRQKGQYVLRLLQINIQSQLPMTIYTLKFPQPIPPAITRILSLTSQSIHILTKKANQHSVYKINLTQNSQEKTYSAELVAAIITDKKQPLQLTGGNLHNLYDQKGQIFYQLNPGQDSNQVYSPRTLAEMQIDTLINTDNLQFTFLNTLALMWSYLNPQTIIFPITDKKLQPSDAIKIKGKVRMFTDKWKNCLFIGDNDFLWVRNQQDKDNSITWTYKLFSESQSSQNDQLLISMLRAQYVSFNGDYAMLVSNETQGRIGSVRSVLFDPNSTPSFKIVDSIRKSINLDQLQFSKSTATGTGTATQRYETESFTCNCIESKITRLQCFAYALKCITMTQPLRTNCTKIV